QAPAVREVHAQAVDGRRTRTAVELRLRDEALDEGMRVAAGGIHLDLRSGDAGGQRGQHLAGRLRARSQDLEQTRRGVDTVVEAVPALAEEDVPAPPAGKHGLSPAH